jgi:Zn-dependent protease
MINLLLSNPIYFLIYAACLLVSIAIHEFSHAFVADRLGDPTPRLQGRLTLNPLVHIDLMGMLFLFIIGFGWGKPVYFDPYNLQNPRRDAALISIAGPMSNFIIAIALSILFKLFIFFHLSFLYTIGGLIIIPLISLNIMLGIFNLIPINPLDGFKIVGGILSDTQSRDWYQLERYGFIFLIMLIFPLGNSSLLDSIIRPVISFILQFLIPGNGVGII